MRPATPTVLLLLLATLVGCTTAPDQRAAVDIEEYPQSGLLDVLGLDGDIGAPGSSLAAEHVANCMQQQGFDVHPSDVFGASRSTPRVLTELQSMSEAQFVAEYGFGVATSGIESMTVITANPIEALLVGMTEDETTAFRSAFYGDGAPGESGCLAEGLAAQQNESTQLRQGLFGQYSQDIEGLIAADTRVVAVHAEFAACMAAKGYAYGTPEEDAFAAIDRFDDWARNRQDRNTTEGWDEVNEQELREASDSLACQAPLRPELIRLRVEIEGKWIAENSDRVTADLGVLDAGS